MRRCRSRSRRSGFRRGTSTAGKQSGDTPSKPPSRRRRPYRCACTSPKRTRHLNKADERGWRALARSRWVGTAAVGCTRTEDTPRHPSRSPTGKRCRRQPRRIRRTRPAPRRASPARRARHSRGSSAAGGPDDAGRARRTRASRRSSGADGTSGAGRASRAGTAPVTGLETGAIATPRRPKERDARESAKEDGPRRTRHRRSHERHLCIDRAELKKRLLAFYAAGRVGFPRSRRAVISKKRGPPDAHRPVADWNDIWARRPSRRQRALRERHRAFRISVVTR